jgi:hypothetical protein
MYPRIFPQLPCEVISHILSFSEDGAVISHYRNGRWGPHIRWNSDAINDIESMHILRQHFTHYWYHDAPEECKELYRILKAYLSLLLRHRRDLITYLLS